MTEKFAEEARKAKKYEEKIILKNSETSKWESWREKYIKKTYCETHN